MPVDIEVKRRDSDRPGIAGGRARYLDVLLERHREGEGTQVSRQLGTNRRVGGGIKRRRLPVADDLPTIRRAAYHAEGERGSHQNGTPVILIVGVAGLFTHFVGVRVEGAGRRPHVDDLDRDDTVELSPIILRAERDLDLDRDAGRRRLTHLLRRCDPQLGEVSLCRRQRLRRQPAVVEHPATGERGRCQDFE